MNIDQSQWTAKDFELLITGNIGIPEDRYDEIMTPTSFEWKKIDKNDWSHYLAGRDEYTYSWEMPGIQMTFNKSITYEEAKKIAEEVLANIQTTGQAEGLVTINKIKTYRFYS